MRLDCFGGIGRKKFASRLMLSTRSLRNKLQKLAPGQPAVEFFGISRKVINIYLHNVFYNRYLSREHGLDCLESWLEVPMDSHVARGLLKVARQEQIAIPDAISGVFKIWELTPTRHRAWQNLAMLVAKALGTQRVHLDAYFYRN